MRYKLIIPFILIAFATASANEMEEQFRQVRQAFEQRDKKAQQDLSRYLDAYPYTTYMSDVQMMMGVLQVEKGKYKNAAKTFQKVEWKQLGREDQALFFFYRGYTCLQLGETAQAAAYFKLLKDSDNPYSLQGKYYYAYCLYTQKEYNKALPEFLDIEHTAMFKKTVPYYIVQIYYAQENYEEVYDRARYLLENNPDNENNGEIHRILGEIYYTQGKYAVAATNLKEYEQYAARLGTDPGREDLYLLGIAEYKTADYPAAITHFKRVKERQDTLSENTCLHLGLSYIQTGDIEKAKLSFAAAARFNLTPAVREEALYNYALATYQSGTALGESINAFTTFLQEYPSTRHAETVHEMLADMYLSSKNYKAALESINAMASPTDRLIAAKQYLRYQLGADALAQGKPDEAKQWMTEVIANAKGTDRYKTEAYFHCAEIACRLHEYQHGYDHLQAFFSQPDASASPNRLNADYMTGYALFGLQRYDEAEQWFRQYADQADPSKPYYADALNRIGDCRFQKRDWQQAAETYRSVAERKGNGADYAQFQYGYVLGLMRRYADKAETLSALAATNPASDYADDALYELARAELQQNRNQQAADAYLRLITNYPNSPLARKASLERAMTFRNMQQYDEAINVYKQTIDKYAGSEEAYTALEGLEQVYVETNNVAAYLAYTRQLGKINVNLSGKEDSLTYAAAELQYMCGNYAEAAAGMSTYINQYCPGGRNCTAANYYAADAYYRIGQKTEAESFYTELARISNNPYIEEAHTRIAELAFDRGDYATAREAFRALQTVSPKQQTREQALLGILRCSFRLDDTDDIIETASALLADEHLTESVRNEALYNRAKAYIRHASYGPAIADLTPLCEDVRIETGAEAEYLIADCYNRLGATDQAEAEIMRFAGMKTQHRYWLAKSLILLADINRQRGDLFQAKQYLLSLQANYNAEDDIQSIIRERLNELEEAETSVAEQEEEEEL